MQRTQHKHLELVETLTELLPRLAPKYSVRLAYLFGSAGTPRFAQESDVDIAILFSRDVELFDLVSNAEMLRLEIQDKIEPPVDISILNLASPLLKYEVVREGRPLYADDVEFQAMFEKVTYEQYFEYGLRQDLYFEFLERRLNEASD